MIQKVAVIRTEPYYPTVSPYHPSYRYPEYPFSGYIAGEKNYVYEGVRQLFYELGLDREHYGRKYWNPLGFLVKPGMTVVLKPNFVLSRHKAGKDLYSIITHPSVLRAIADYVWIALKGQGKTIIADAPQYDCNFDELLKATRLKDVVRFYTSFSRSIVEVRDLRPYWSRWKHFSSMLEPLPGDPEGKIIVNLGERSALYGKPNTEKLYGAVYHRNETIAHHHRKIHEYEFSRTVMNADVVISVPKLKVHKKVGVTLNTKGLVGICTNKNYLVHYTLKPISQGGDQYPNNLFSPMEEVILKIERWMYDHFLAKRKRFWEYIHRSIYWLHNHTTKRLGLKVDEKKRMLDAGNWYGNDSAWRMVVDLMKIFYFVDVHGHMHSTPQRRIFSVIDGVIGGDNNGPLTPDPEPAGVLLAGENLLAVDIVATRLMGFNPLKIKIYDKILKDDQFNFGIKYIEDIDVCTPEKDWINCLLNNSNQYLDFKPHPGWRGHLEIKPHEKTVHFPLINYERSSYD